MSATAESVRIVEHAAIAPGSLKRIGYGRGHDTKVTILEPAAAVHSDSALLHYCDENPCFWGRINRYPDRVEVVVYTN